MEGLNMTERIVLGSGKLYIAEFNSAEGIPSNAELETGANRAGYIKGGATLEYKPEFYEAKDDLGYAMKRVLTEEEVIFKSGIMTWNMKKLMALCNTGRKDETNNDENVSIYKLGGIGNYDGKRYVVHFHHEDKIDGDLRVTIIGANQAGFTLSFMKNQETVADAEFKAEPYDNEGTLVLLQESIPTEEEEEEEESTSQED
jgi:hypothetical protein